MRKVSHGHGFWLSYILNMAFRAEWLLLAVLLFAGYFVLKWKPLMWCALCALAVWFIYPLILTIFLGWVRRVGSEPEPHKENKNPYSNGRKAEKDNLFKKFDFNKNGQLEDDEKAAMEAFKKAEL